MESRAELRRIFKEATTSESIFQLVTHLDACDDKDVADTLKDLFETMRDITRSDIQRSPELLASFGVYLALILRCAPKTDYYLDGEHYFSIALQFYYPYVSLFISIMLIPAHLCGIDIDASVSEVVILPGQPLAIEERANSSPLRLSREADEAIERARRISPHNSQLFNQQASPPLNSRNDKPLPETVLSKTAALCNLGSMERNFLFELKRLQGWGVNNFMKRLGLKSQKHEMAIFLDDPTMLEGSLSEDDIVKAIFMHANKVVLSDRADLLPHHFDRALAYLNYPVAKTLDSRSDWVSTETLEDLIFSSRNLKHPLCLKLLILAFKKNIELCDHKLKKIPIEWRDKLLEVYMTPRWRSAKVAKDAKSKVKNATLEYYRLHLCCPESTTPEILTHLESLNSKLQVPHAAEKFIENVRNMNKSFYILQVSGYMDFLTEQKINFGNDRDLIGNDIFELSKNFVFVIREKDRIYLIDYGAARTLISKGENPYNRQPICEKVRDEITKRFQYYNTLGIGMETIPLSELLEEFLRGRQKCTACACIRSKNYRAKLVRVLRNYGIRDENMDHVIIQDIVFKLGLIAIDLKAQNLLELCENLYRAIKTARDDCRESLKRTIASIIKIYSSVLPGGMLLNM